MLDGDLTYIPFESFTVYKRDLSGPWLSGPCPGHEVDAVMYSEETLCSSPDINGFIQVAKWEKEVSCIFCVEYLDFKKSYDIENFKKYWMHSTMGQCHISTMDRWLHICVSWYD